MRGSLMESPNSTLKKLILGKRVILILSTLEILIIFSEKKRRFQDFDLFAEKKFFI